MGLLKSAFNMVSRLHSIPMTHKRIGGGAVPTIYSPVRGTPSNYFRYLAGPAETVVTGAEFILPVAVFLGTAAQRVSFSTVPTTGTWKLSYNSVATSDLSFNAIASDIQTALRLITGLGNVTVTGDYTAGFTVNLFGIQTPFTLVGANGGSVLDASITVATLPIGILPIPLLARGDKLLDGSKSWTVKEIIDMPDLGGDTVGYRVRVE